MIGGVLHLYPADPRLLSRLVRRAGMAKGQWNSEWIYEVIVSPKKPTKNYKDFCPTKQTRIIANFFGDFLVIVGSFFGYDPCLFGWAEILVILASRNFWLAFWEKQWSHKFIMNLTDLYVMMSSLTGCPTENWIFWGAHSCFFNEYSVFSL